MFEVTRPARLRGLTLLLLVGAAAILNVAAAAIPESETALQQEERYWKFRVYLDDREIGYHEFRVAGDGRQTRVEINAQFDVKFLFITAYTYRHTNIEIWRNGCLSRIESETDANGDLIEVKGTLGESGFALDGSEVDSVVESDCVKTFAYWNPAILQADRLLNAQTGEWVPVDVVEQGPETLQLEGSAVEARRYQINMEEGAIDLWYHGETGQWLSLRAPTEGGRVLRYEPVGLPRALRPDERLAME
jgi:hypothetical protein